MAQRRMRIGVVGANGGTDRWGARAHLPAIAALAEAELVAVCTAREETAKRAQQRTGTRLAFWDYRAMVHSPDIDLVTVAVRIALHHPIVMAALDAGKDVFCEWPLALTAAQATELSTRAQAQGVAHAVGTQGRFSPGIMYAKELMEGDYVGRPLFFHMTHFLSSALAPRPSSTRTSVRRSVCTRRSKPSCAPRRRAAGRRSLSAYSKNLYGPHIEGRALPAVLRQNSVCIPYTQRLTFPVVAQDIATPL